MKLEDIGYTQELESYCKEHHLDSFEVGRVISEHKERYVVRTATKEFDAELLGNLRYTAEKRSDFPAVGDWVAMAEYDEDKAIIHAVLPRKNSIERQSVGKTGEKQIIAANIDYALILQAVDRDFNLNRIDRYLTISNSAKVKPLIILNKIDLIDQVELHELIDKVSSRVKHVPVIAISNETGKGYESLLPYIYKGMTYCLLGSSGVGKSTLINKLSGKSQIKTNSISTTTGKGRHVTTHRELFVLENGGIFIDNPGMREVGVTDSAEGLEMTFDGIAEFSQNCKFKDCAHTTESECAVLEAVSKGNINMDSYENYLKMEREKAHFESTLAEKRKREKQFGKIMKDYKKNWRK